MKPAAVLKHLASLKWKLDTSDVSTRAEDKALRIAIALVKAQAAGQEETPRA